MRILTLLLACLLCVACQNQTPAQTTETPIDSPTATTTATESDVTPLAELVEFLRTNGEVPDVALKPEMATSERLPKELSPDSIYIGGTPVPAEVVEYVNSRKSGSSWSSRQVDEANREGPDTAVFDLAISDPAKLSDGRWHALAEWTEREGGTIKKIGVVSYTLADGRLANPEFEVLLAASSVRIRKFPSAESTP
ncbi:MAG: hypothetical protein KC800_14355 [Candidatus Eremiobacteraeota bacterium]|nr:hypothetical protein [Candidatus Eremiobacteraeota bacterium]